MTWINPEEPRLLDHIPPWLQAGFRLAIRFAIIGLILSILAAVYFWLQASRYDLTQVEKMPARTLLLDSNGREIAAVHGTRRRLISRDEIPPHLVAALVAREDRRFFDHSGVHLRGVARATLRNLIDRQFTQGASTLTMQLARNTFQLTQKSLHRKLLEVALAYRLEANFTKDEILTAYLNRIYFGAGAFGIEQAAKSYFGKKTSELSIPEASLLVGIIRAPHDFSPRINKKAALRERETVLKLLRDAGTISNNDFLDLRCTPLQLHPAVDTHTDAVRCIRRHLNELLDSSDFQLGGLTARTTIDLNLQKNARNSLNNLLVDFPDLQCALVAIEPKSGAIRAIITARDPKSSQFNRAFDSRPQLGPAFQPFLYAFAVERGRLPIQGQPLQTARQLPDGELPRLAKRLGLSGPFEQPTEELARGNFRASPLEAATAAAVIANLGQKSNSHLIQTLQDKAGNTLFQQNLRSTPVIEKDSAQATLDQLPSPTWSEPNAPRTDLWVLHADPNLGVALWFGFDDPRPLPKLDQLTSQAQALVRNLANSLSS